MSKHDTLQAEIVAWAAKTFPGSDLRGVHEHWRDECYELDASLMVAVNHDRKGDDLRKVTHYSERHLIEGFDPETGSPTGGVPVIDEIAEECADIMHLLFQVADKCGFDLLEATREKFEINKGRTWGEPDERGVVRHVPAPEGGDA